jgi:PTH1 family peptidyl-tRNA hydrolase
MLLIVGLGNPGPKFARHRHNVGFMAVDRIINRHSFIQSQNKFKSEIFEGKLAHEKALIIKPQTFMNLSGEAVGEVMRFYKLDISDIIVIHDELDLVAGKTRIKTGGSHGGHNGLRSIDAHCGKEYQRIRIGIDHPGHKARVNSHVLGDFAKSDYIWLDPLLDAIADHIDLAAKHDAAGLMNKIALATGGANPKPAKKANNAAKSENIGKPSNKAKSDEKPESKISATPGMEAKSHIRQAQTGPDKPKASGPMAEMLKKLLGDPDKS